MQAIAHELVGAFRLRPVVRWIKGTIPALENQYVKHISTPRRQYYRATLRDWLREEITNTLIPYWLRSGEKTYMGVPVEARCPFLDYRVVELATRLPTTYLIRDGWHKWILRKAMEDFLPADVVWRRVKMGFPYPYERFFSVYRDIINLILSRTHNPFVDLARPERLRTDWNALSFVLWYEYFINGNHGLFADIESMLRTPDAAREAAYIPEFLREELSRITPASG